MALKGAGGRWTVDEDLERAENREADAALAPTTGLSAVEVICFAAVIALLFWLSRELPRYGVRPSLFQGMRPEMHLFLNLAVAVGAFLVGLSGTRLARGVRVAGAMLSAVVAVALLYVMTFLNQNLYFTGFCVAMASGSALCSRTGLPRDQGYPAALVAASIMLLGHVGIAWSIR